VVEWTGATMRKLTPTEKMKVIDRLILDELQHQNIKKDDLFYFVEKMIKAEMEKKSHRKR